MKAATLLIAAGLLSSLIALPATASPLLIDSATYLAQASVNPVYMKYDDIDGSASAIQEVIDLTDAWADAPAPYARAKYANITLKRGLLAAAEAHTSTNAAGDPQLDTEGFARDLALIFGSKDSDFAHYAALGWGISEKSAASKLAKLARATSLPAVQDATFAILTGMGTSFKGGVRVATGDVNGDGTADLIAEAQFTAADSVQGWGR